jgi:hypothetical protein
MMQPPSTSMMMRCWSKRIGLGSGLGVDGIRSGAVGETMLRAVVHLGQCKFKQWLISQEVRSSE